MLECQSSPLKARTIAENPFKSSEVLRHEIGLIFELPQDADAIQFLTYLS